METLSQTPPNEKLLASLVSQLICDRNTHFNQFLSFVVIIKVFTYIFIHSNVNKENLLLVLVCKV